MIQSTHVHLFDLEYTVLVSSAHAQSDYLLIAAGEGMEALGCGIVTPSL